jgi:hypothetical protein
MDYSTTTATVTTLPFNGKILAITADGTALLVSDSAGNGTFLYSTANAARIATAVGAATAGAVTPDSQWSLSLIGPTVVRVGNNVPIISTNLTYTPSAIDVLAQGSLTFITNPGGQAVDVRSTCDESELQTLSATNPSLIQRLPNGTGAVAVDVPNIDVIATAQPSGSCPVVASSTLTGYDLGAGSFTPQQLLVSSDSSRAWIIGNQNSVLTFDLNAHVPTSIPLAGGVVGYTGGLTLDGSQLYVGSIDGTVHRIALSSLSDAQQIGVGLTDANSNPVPPDLVTILPK